MLTGPIFPGIIHPDARPAPPPPALGRFRRAFNPQPRALRASSAVKRLGNLQPAGQSPRSIDSLQPTQQYRRGITLRPGDEVQHPMHAVAKINIPKSRWSEHDAVAGRHSPRRVGSPVARPAIRFDLGDSQPRHHPTRPAPTKPPPEQCRCDDLRRLMPEHFNSLLFHS